DERAAPVAGPRLRHGLRTRAGATVGKTRFGRRSRPSGRASAVTAKSPWPVEAGRRRRTTAAAGWLARAMERSRAASLLQLGVRWGAKGRAAAAPVGRDVLPREADLVGRGRRQAQAPCGRVHPRERPQGGNLQLELSILLLET